MSKSRFRINAFAAEHRPKDGILGKSILMDYKIHRFDEVDSTNSLLKKGNYPVGSVAACKIQTKGAAEEDEVSPHRRADFI